MSHSQSTSPSLESPFTEEQNRTVAGKVIALICREFGTNYDEIRANNYRKPGAPRWIATLILLDHTQVCRDYTARAINRRLTSLYNFRIEARNLIATDPEIARKTERIIAQLPAVPEGQPSPRLRQEFRDWVMSLFSEVSTAPAVQRRMLQQLAAWEWTGDPRYAIPGYDTPPPFDDGKDYPFGWSKITLLDIKKKNLLPA